jgi:hypothetical protein
MTQALQNLFELAHYRGAWKKGVSADLFVKIN